MPWLTILIALAAVSGCRDGASPPESSSFRVASSSMAPMFNGPSLTMTCEACRRVHLVASDTFRPEWLCRCPSCGGVCRPASSPRPGTVVEVDRSQETSRLPRFALVAFVPPSRRSEPDMAASLHQPMVKRIWGLPGEKLELHDGELWIDGQLMQKSLDEFERLAVPVAQFQTATDRAARFPIAIASNNSASFRWTYRRPARVNPRHQPADAWLTASPLMDDYPWNQGESRQLQAVSDWLVKLRWSPVGQIANRQVASVTIHSHLNSVHIDVYPTQKFAPAPATPNLGDRTPLLASAAGELTIAICDGRLLIRSENLISTWDIATHATKKRHSDDSGDSWTIDVAACDNRRLESFELYRDLCLFTGRRAQTPQPFVVPTDGYFVMGDNLPASFDSRNGLGCISQSSVLGIVRVP